MTKMNRILLLIFASLISIAAAATENKVDEYRQVRDGITRLGVVYRELSSGYVDEINPDLILRAGIDGMLSKLDPYTVYLDKQEASDFDVMASGKYGGIGVEMGLRGPERELTVMSVFDGYPAAQSGMRVGDVLLQVDSNKTTGWSTGKASTFLRGAPNTPIVVTVRRSGTKESVLRFEMKRAQIEVQEVAYSGIIDDSTGYIRLVRFGHNAKRDLAIAIDSLLSKGMKRCILDLRQNPGGLLNSAIDVSQEFLNGNDLIVSTRGRDSMDVQEFRSFHAPHFTGPMAVLVDEGSASASEIVAGALQDQDRAIILGSRSFGKGLVQTIRRLPGEVSLKMTTAKYYTPSGRLIQKTDYFHGVDSIADVGKKYFSRNGRLMSAHGGITPDVEIAAAKPSAMVTELLRSGHIPAFVNEYLSNLGSNKKQRSVDESMLSKFQDFLKTKGFSVPLEIDAEWIAIKDWLQKKNHATDTSPQLESVGQVIDTERASIWNNNRNELIRLLSIETTAWYEGNRGRYRAAMERDTVVSKATELLKQPQRIRELLATKSAQ